ncbi:putative outer membrane insertion C- signal [Escherichia coli TA206]|uniref:YadA C-terminal domain-containing protein n=1 Tax=Escherichia coli TaxID=562 RepID=UPI0001E8A741|nr:YadA C-terminal domain-containing protein [Escherichia coli]EGI25765.1 putative outer membrane insertion C- signal [Escherichia coli TA206]
MFCKPRVFKAGILAMSVGAALLSSGVSAQGNDTITLSDLDQKYDKVARGTFELIDLLDQRSDGIVNGVVAIRDDLHEDIRSEGDSLRGEIGGVQRDSFAHTDQTAEKLRGEMRIEGDSLRGEIGGVQRDSFSHTDQTAEKLRGEMRSEGDSLRGEIGGVKRDSYEHTDKKFAEAGKAIRSAAEQSTNYTNEVAKRLNDKQEKSEQSTRLLVGESFKQTTTMVGEKSRMDRAYTEQLTSENRRRIDAVNSASGVNAHAVSENRQAIGTNSRAIATNRQAIGTNSRAIAANTRALRQHEARMNDMSRKIDDNNEEMRKAAAQSAALSGLFQPYTVGAFNVTAAMGGYSDKQAVAVGAGYRFNDTVAAKAGVAVSDGDPSWNVGVNLEF